MAIDTATTTYDYIFERSMEDREAFWLEASSVIEWEVPPGPKVLDDEAPPFYRWFPGARLNTCHNALDRHVEGGRGEQAALVWDSPVTGSGRTYTYRELRDEVARLAGLLRDVGVAAGDTVLLYMPMVPEAVMGMLACARLGAVHSVVFGGFAPPELAARIDHAHPKVILSASCGIDGGRAIAYKPMLDAALGQASHKPTCCLILQRPQAVAELVMGRDLDWAEAVATAEPAPCVSVAATDPLYILYTSGTTGRPKGVVRDNGGHAVALHWSMSNVYGVAPGDVYWAASDVGWIVGHSYIVYGPLLLGATTVLYEGKPVGTPDAGAFWRVIEEHGVNVLFATPTALRAIKKEDAMGSHLARYDTSSLRHLFLAGERLDPDTYHWASGLLGIPVVDHWWQTETAWPIAANCVGLGSLSIKPGSPTKAVPGYNVHVLDAEGGDCAPGEEGAVAIKLPLPPGTLPTLWNDDERFVSSYLSRYPGYYLTGDGGHLDADGYLFVMGRIDDVINAGAHRLSSGAMEEVISSHPDVAECAVIGVCEELKGQVPMAFVVLKGGVARDARELEAELVAMVGTRIGPFTHFQRALVVNRLPKTRSGKILRSSLRKIADRVEYAVPSTIDDPAILDEIAAVLKV